jgi:GNAT superfamily N-acetyltransferase
MIEKASFDQLSAIYRKHIISDFPRAERRPLKSMEALFKKDQYNCLMLMEEGELLSYATFLHSKNIGCVLLDLYAVLEGRRGEGIGSHFLELMTLGWKDKDGIIIESELPSKAADADDFETRTRRIAFYEKNGAQAHSRGWHLFGVDYNLLWLPINKALDEVNLEKDLLALYSLGLSPAVQKANTYLFDLTV